ncbi:MAG: diguanylate cyclase, partial [Pseudomonadota bacterium]
MQFLTQSPSLHSIQLFWSVISLTFLLCGAGWAAVARPSQPDRAALKHWSLLSICLAAGFFTQLWIGFAVASPVEAAIPIACNVFLMCGICQLRSGLIRFAGRVPERGSVLVPVGLTLAVGVLAESLSSVRLRIGANSVLMAVMLILCSIQVWRVGGAGVGRRAIRALVIAQVLFVATLIGRVVTVVMAPAGAGVETPPLAWMNFVLGGVVLVVNVMLQIGLVGLLVGRMAGRLERQAEQDSLTGLLNRHGAQARLEAWAEACAAASPGEAPLGAILLIDLDHFKRINDSFGHAVGDEVLRRIGAFLHQRVRAADKAFRIGGEEFLLLLYACDTEACRHFAEELRRAIAAQPLVPDCAVTISVGVATAAPG